ncbi:MAG TPA: class I SAM-dependent methyltransferase [Candidatus Dormibacteraeota bacterium]|nr:class I SAM-dependent methyltransferase [Candidatus Dormibacteraeota bacterium]
MTADHYTSAARGWACGAMRVYGPIAAELVATSPHALAGRRVLDAGAGTGAVSAELAATGAHPLATDLSLGMLAWHARRRPPSSVADIRALPLASDSVDDSVAAFVLNHLVDPEAGFGELVRVTRPGGAVLAAVFGALNRNAVRDRIDEVAVAAGYSVPGWYVETKTCAVPLLGSALLMEEAARAAGLDAVAVEERPVDVGITRCEDLVDYRLGQAHYAEWVAALGPEREARLRHDAAGAIRDVMEPYRPVVVFLSALVP